MVIDAMEVIVCKGDGRHAASVVGVGYVVDELELAKMLLSSRGGGSSTNKATRDSTNGAV